MKITIEAEPKEIAAYELALRDGEKVSIGKLVLKGGETDVDKIAKSMLDRLQEAANVETRV